jgi:hypothetical protein
MNKQTNPKLLSAFVSGCGLAEDFRRLGIGLGTRNRRTYGEE